MADDAGLKRGLSLVRRKSLRFFSSSTSCTSEMPHQQDGSEISFDGISDSVSEKSSSSIHSPGLKNRHLNEDEFFYRASFSSSRSQGNDSRCLVSFKAHDSGICTIALADGVLYSGSEDGEICCFRLADLKEMDRFGASSNGSVKSILVRGSDVFSAHQDHKIRGWKRPSHRLVSTLPSVKDYVSTAVIQRNYVRVRRHRKSPWNQHFDTISCLALDDRAGILYSGSWDRSLKLWRLKDFKCVESIDAHTDAINAVAVDPRNGVVFSGSADSSVKIWKRKRIVEAADSWTTMIKMRKSCIRERLCLLDNLKQGGPVNCIALSGNWVYVGCSDGRIFVWMVVVEEEDYGDEEYEGDGQGDGEHGESSPSSSVFQVSSPDSASSASSRVYREEFAALAGHSMSVLSIAASGDLVCSGSADRSIRVWKREEEESGKHSCLCVLQEIHSRSPVKSVKISVDILDGCIVYSAGLDGFIKVWWVSLVACSPRSKPRITESPCSVLDYRYR